MKFAQTLLRSLHALRWPVTLGLLIGVLALQWQQLQHPQEASNLTFADAVKQAAPAVVNIYTTHQVEQPPSQTLSNPLLAPFIQPRPGASTTQTRLGSGVIVDPDGLVLTNYHVIQQATNIHVALQDGREIDAKVIGVDPESDLGLLKIDLHPLPYIKMDHGHQEQVGDVVLAIGNPFGVGQTVTQGIVSATGRTDLGLTTFEDFIQTDAAINPGNSGGALINTRGQLVGINTAIVSRSGGNQGIGFAIPTMLALKIMTDLEEYGHVIRGYLGVEMHQLSKQEAEFFNLQHTNGLIITGIYKGSPADEAGIKPGDVVLEINNHPIRRAVDALNQVAQFRPGTKIELTVYRAGTSLQLQAVVRERPENLSGRG